MEDLFSVNKASVLKRLKLEQRNHFKSGLKSIPIIPANELETLIFY